MTIVGERNPSWRVQGGCNKERPFHEVRWCAFDNGLCQGRSAAGRRDNPDGAAGPHRNPASLYRSTRRCSSSEVTMIHRCPSGGPSVSAGPAAGGTAGDAAGAALSINYTAPDALIAVMKPFLL